MGPLARIDARVKLVCLVVYVIATLHAHTVVSLGICLAIAIALAASVRMSARDTAGVLRPLLVILVITAIMQVLSIQQGDVLVQLGPVAVTAAALASIARMVVGLFCIMLASVAFMRCTPSEELARAFGWLLSPLRRAGVRVDGLLFSLSVAFRFAPVLVSEFGQLKRAQAARGADFGGGVRERLSSYARLFAPLVRSSFRKADNLAEASVSRCFGGAAERTNLHRARFGVREVACLVCAAALVAVVIVL